MRKFLISSALVLSVAGLAACSDSGVDENATGSVEGDPAVEQPVEPADPMAQPEPAPAPAQ